MGGHEDEASGHTQEGSPKLPLLVVGKTAEDEEGQSPGQESEGADRAVFAVTDSQAHDAEARR